MWWLPGLLSHHSALTLQTYQTFIPWQTCQVLFHSSPNYSSSGEVISFRCSSCVIFSVRLTTGRIRGSYTLYMCLWSRWPVIYVDRSLFNTKIPLRLLAWAFEFIDAGMADLCTLIHISIQLCYRNTFIWLVKIKHLFSRHLKVAHISKEGFN